MQLSRGSYRARPISAARRVGYGEWRGVAAPGYARVGIGRVRRVLTIGVVALVAAGCRDAAMVASPPAGPTQLLIRESPSPYREVTAGAVSAILPDSWTADLAGANDDPRQGLVAGPRADVWNGHRLPTEGFAAVWIDGAAVGVPSDYYYLAASRALDFLARTDGCSAGRHRVFVDHRPAFAAGGPQSPGDYIASGGGRCMVGDQPSRWAYFVAAPGYGPVRELGIPSSGLYLVVAMTPDAPGAPHLLTRLLERTEFGGASVADLIAAVRPAPGIPAPI